MNEEEFIGKAVKHLVSEGKSIRLIAGESVKCDGQPTGGFYCENGLNVATKSKAWFETFVHEYCHFLQELDKGYNPGDDGMWGEYDEWLSGGKTLSQKKLKLYTDKIRACEVDCEKRVVKLIREYDLPIDEKRYIQEANVYAQFYSLATKYRSWYKKVSPCSIEALADMMPTHFKRTWDNVPTKFENIVVDKCFNL